jgi:hypothetical protein
MRQIFSKSFIVLMLVICAAGAAPAAHAQTPTNGAACDYTDAGSQDGTIQNGKCVSNGTYGFANTTDNTAANIEANKAAAATPITPDNPIKNDAAYASIIQWIMKLFAWLVGVAAITLDNAVYYTVVTMGSYVKNLAAVGVTWRILRDIGNIMLIFGFLAVGITTILNVDWYGGGKKMLPMMLAAAVFLNFSLFISEAIIDTGNLFATQFYTQINGGNPAGAKNFDLTSISNDGISNKIMAQLGLQGIYSAALSQNTEIFKAGNSWIIGFMGIILFIVTAFVLFSLAFVLIARFVVLLFLIILAPVGFAGLAVPQLKSTAKKWWNALFEQTITAPVLLLTLYIALAVITDAKFMTGFGSSSNSNGWTGTIRDATGTANLTGFAALLLSFLVAMGLLLAVILFSKKLSAFGADFASQTAGKLTFGLTAAGMRSTAGAGLNSAARRFRSAKIGNVRLAAIPIFGRTVTGALDKGAKASFDVRGTSALKNFPGGSIDAGKAQVGGYRQTEKDAIKAREDHAKTLTQTETEKVMQKNEEDRKKKMDEALKSVEKENNRAIQELREEHKDEMEGHTDAVQNAQKNLSKLKDDQRAGATITQEEITAAQQALDAARNERAKKAAEQRKKEEDLKKLHEQSVEVQKKAIEVQQEEVDKLKRSGPDQYAKNLQMMPWGKLYRNEKAAANILKEAKKSKSDKDMDTIKKLLEDNEKKGSGGEEKKEEKKPEAPAPKPAS